MSITAVRISPAADARCRLHVLAVDFELRLFQDGGEEPVFDARQGQSPSSFELDRSSRYCLRYNNNDGGQGVLHVQVREERTEQVVRHEVNRSAIDGPSVIELWFRLSTDPTLSAPG